MTIIQLPSVVVIVSLSLFILLSISSSGLISQSATHAKEQQKVSIAPQYQSSSSSSSLPVPQSPASSHKQQEQQQQQLSSSRESSKESSQRPPQLTAEQPVSHHQTRSVSLQPPSPSPPLPLLPPQPQLTPQTSSQQQQVQQPKQQHLRFEFQRYDGWYNNLANSDWGSPNSRLRRKVPPAYLDGVYLMNNDDRPSARLLSQKLMRGEDGQPSQRNLTTLFTFFGQVVASEILMASESGCPIEMHRIRIGKCDPMYDRDCTGKRTMPFYRAAYDPATGQSPNLPREQINKVTSWIDGSFIYSTSETWLNTMRSFDGHGTLKMVPTTSMAVGLGGADGGSAAIANLLDTTIGNLVQSPSAPQLFGYPVRNKHRAPLINAAPAQHLRIKTPERMFLLGDPRTNQNPLILAFGILFYRWHNVLAERIYAEHKDWSDEEIFQRARRLVIASLQNIILYEYLPTLLDAEGDPSTSSDSSNNANTITSDLSSEDRISPYTGYKPDLHPGISHVFQSAAFRFGHTMIPPGLYLRDEKCQFLNTSDGYEGIRLCSTWWNAEEVVSGIGIEQLLMGAASQIAEREDYVLCNDVRDKLFGPLDFSRRDLAALNIMRGRDNGLADYNTVRRAFQLAPITNWSEINPHLAGQMPELFQELADLYQNRLDNVDLYIGGMLESEAHRGRPGPLFRRIIREQFERLRDADRFWFENTESGIFTPLEIEEIKQIRLYDIIANSTLIPEDSIQREVFKFKPGDPCPQPKQLSSRQLRSCFAIKGWSYFKGSEVTFIMVCLTLIFIPILCCLAAYGVIKLQNSKRRQYKARLEYSNHHQQQQQQQQRNSSKQRQVSSHHHQQVTEEEQATNGNRSATTSDGQSGYHNNSMGSNGSLEISSNESTLTTTTTSTLEKLSACDKFYAKEWLHSNLKRYIKVRLGPDETIYTLDRKGQTQRKLDLSQVQTIMIEISQDCDGSGSMASASANHSDSTNDVKQREKRYQRTTTTGTDNNHLSMSRRHPLTQSSQTSSTNANANTTSGNNDYQQHEPMAQGIKPHNRKPMILIRVARDYDLVLQFQTIAHRQRFLDKLNLFLANINKSVDRAFVGKEIMLANAETKEKRQQKLDNFFREAYALTFGLKAPTNTAAQELADHGAYTNEAMELGSTDHLPAPPSSLTNPTLTTNTNTTTTPTINYTASSGNASSPIVVSSDVRLIMRTSLSRQEFAEALGMRSDSLFVRQMFNCVDKDGDGRISFQEFLDTVAVFSKGKPEDRLRIVFDMCDHNRKGLIEKEDLVRTLRSLVDIAKTRSLKEDNVDIMIQGMFESVGLQDKQLLTYQDFKLIMGTYNDQPEFVTIGLDMKGAKKNFFLDPSLASAQNNFRSASYEPWAPTHPHHHAHLHHQPLSSPKRKMTLIETVPNNHHQKAGSNLLNRFEGATSPVSITNREPSGKSILLNLRNRWNAIATFIEEHRQDIVYLMIFYVAVAVSFLERFVNYSYLSEHMDLRHVMGIGIAITRGSAAALSLCFALLLLTMCRKLMTKLRDTPFREYIPLDSHMKFHKLVAYTGGVMTVIHTIGHCVNFWHISNQPVEHLRCMTKEMAFNSDARPTFFFWVFETVTGITGLILWILCSIVYVFAHRKVRQFAYSYFWSTHKLYYAIYALSLLHGSSKLTGSPRFWIFFMLPAILFAIDQLISLQTKLQELEILETELLPSDVTRIKFVRPAGFRYLSGQWIRMACTAFRQREYHAFTLTSAPHEDHLSVYVKAHGPWTWKLRSCFDPVNMQFRKINLPPRIRIDGPFGGGNQDWYKYEVAVMIGGGIGVTPYASILKDLVFGTSTNRYSGVACKKVYFIWICPSHRNFEWFIDVLREVEKKDITNVLEMHIFITQFFHKFDLRTTMLYICENHLQRLSNRSLFTGLKAVNHFGRPDLPSFLQYVQKQHSYVNKVGVFSCGPKPMTKSITQACETVNNKRDLPFFLHQYENFS